MEQQATKCTFGQTLEGVFKPFGPTMYDSEFGELGIGIFTKKFYELKTMVVQQAMADVTRRKEDDEIRKQTHAWMGQPVNAVGSFAYWLNPTPTEEALAGLSDDELRVLSAALDPNFLPTGTRERFRQVKGKVLRKLRTLN